MSQAETPSVPPSGRMPLKPLSVLSQQERRLVRELRIAAAPAAGRAPADREHFETLPPRLRAALSALGEEAQGQNLLLFAANSAFVSDDELAVLGGLALLQRPTKSARWRVTNAFQRALATCAGQLLEAERRLPLRQSFTPAQVDRSCFQLANLAQACAHRSARERKATADLKWDGHTEPAPGTRKAQAIALTRDRTSVPVAELLAIGISRQYLSLLCKWGYLEKAGHGRYRFPLNNSKNKTDTMNI